MSADKYLSIFSRQMKAIVHIYIYIYIDYYMLRVCYHFYSRVFNTISRTSEFSSE